MKWNRKSEKPQDMNSNHKVKYPAFFKPQTSISQWHDVIKRKKYVLRLRSLAYSICILFCMSQLHYCDYCDPAMRSRTLNSQSSFLPLLPCVLMNCLDKQYHAGSCWYLVAGTGIKVCAGWVLGCCAGHWRAKEHAIIGHICQAWIKSHSLHFYCRDRIRITSLEQLLIAFISEIFLLSHSLQISQLLLQKKKKIDCI